MKRISHFLVLGAWLLLMQGCGRSLDEPGQRGEVPPVPFETADADVNANAVIQLEIADAIPRELACGAKYVFTAAATEIQAGCDDYHYGLLYREARRHVDERVADVRCWDAKCPQLNTYLVLQDGSCKNSRATVELSVVVQCIAENAPPVRGLQFLDDSELRGPFRQLLTDPPTPPTTNERLAIELRPSELTETCPFDFKYWITMQERVTACNTVTNYGPYVDKARRQAEKIAEATRCARENCRKFRFDEIGASWDCQQNNVIVRYVFRVPCRQV